jgi:hypothetical protein
MKTKLKVINLDNVFEERYPEHDNPEWMIRTWAQEEELARAKSEHENFIRKFNDLLLG